jgi:two-component system, NarL family, response regulator LiaR
MGGEVIQTKTIGVMIVDDHDILRRGLRISLLTSKDIEVVGEAANGAEAVERCEFLKPDVILMDLMMPKMDGVEATRIIREKHPKIQVLALTSFDEKPLMQSMIQAGAIGYLLKNVSIQELSNAIRDAHAGKSTISREAAQVLLDVVRQPAPNYTLTRREKEVLGYMIKGLTNDEIACKLVVSPATSKKHVGNILSKLNASNRAEAVAIALQQHLVDVEMN